MQWRSAAQAPLLVNFDGRLDVREPMEGPAREHMVIDRFVSVQPDTTCESIAIYKNKANIAVRQSAQ
jgi:hypothetical protein